MLMPLRLRQPGPGVWNPCGKRQNCAGQLAEIEFQRRVELEEAAHERCPDVVNAGLERVITDRLADVILELELALDRILRNVGVGAELDVVSGT